MEQHLPQGWKQQLLQMGYDPADIARADHAGVTQVSQAVDWLLANPSNHHTTNSHHFSPTSHHSNPVPQQPHTSHSKENNQNQQQPTKQTPPPIHNLALAPHTTPSTSHTPQPLPLPQDDELRRVMEMSRLEQDDRDMETALRMSKEEDAARRVANQDSDVMRAIQQSLEHNQPFPAHHQSAWPSVSFPDPAHTFRTNIDDPVGLRNIGNTCYLNSLLQVYYHLPDFRRAIMSFRAPPTHPEPLQGDTSQSSVHTKPVPTSSAIESHQIYPSEPPPQESSQEARMSDNSDNHVKQLAEQTVQRNAVEFVVELQRLFSIMALGNKNCADPTAVTRAMRDSNGNPISIGAQRDASEFNQLFLDTIEKGLGTSHLHPAPNGDDHIRTPDPEYEQNVVMAQTDNTVKNMFTMNFRQEIWRCSGEDKQTQSGTNEPMTTNWDTTSVIVDATTRHDRNLHGGLEDFVRTQIKYFDGSRDRDPQSSSTSEMKEDPIPSQPHQESTHSSEAAENTALKMVWFTRLPTVVVVYLQRGSYNRETLRAEKVHDRYEFPIRLALDRYLEINREAAEAARKEVQAIRTERHHLLQLLDQYKRFPVDEDVKLSGHRNDYGREDFFEAGIRIQKRLREAMQTHSTFHSVPGVTKANIEASLDTIEKILDHDRKRCNELEARLNLIQPESDVYRELEKVVYDLHAVLVHDGAPESGHYWTFVNNRRSQNENEKWMKLSDSNVSLVSEEEMLSWSLGGNGKASAYCLMYRSSSDVKEEESIFEESKALLPEQIIRETEEA